MEMINHMRVKENKLVLWESIKINNYYESQ